MSVRVTNNDIVLLGHGSYSGGATNFKLPDNIDLYVLQPVGYTLRIDVAEALIQQKDIKILTLHHGNGESATITTPFAVFEGGNNAPDLKLYNLGNLTGWGSKTIGDKTNVVTVNDTMLLSQLINNDTKIKKAFNKVVKGENLKLYWSACASQIGGNSASL